MEGKVFCFIMVTSLGAELDLTTDWSYQTQESIKIRENTTMDDTYWYDPMVGKYNQSWYVRALFHMIVSIAGVAIP